MEHRREADEVWLQAGDLLKTDPQQIVDLLARLVKLGPYTSRYRRLAEMGDTVFGLPALEDLALVLVLGVPGRSRTGRREDPVAQKVLGRPRRDGVVDRRRDHLGEDQRRVEHSDL